MTNVYEKCPEFEDDALLLRLIQSGDRDDLLSVYSDEKSVPLFNSDNCHGDDFFYRTRERMMQAIDFWKYSYANGYFVRWTIVDKERKRAIGTVELFRRAAHDHFDGYGILRLDLKSEDEKKDRIENIMNLILKDAYDLFDCERIATKAIGTATERRAALEGLGFSETDERLIGQDGKEYDSYFERSIR